MKSSILSALIASATVPSVALAHAHVIRSDPAAATIVHASPKVVRIRFSEPVLIAFSGAEVVDGAGRSVAAGHATIDPRDPHSIALPLGAPLKPGAYTVRWHAVSADTHRVQGRFGFQVKP